MVKKDLIKHSYQHALKPFEVKHMINNLTGIDRFIFSTLVYTGLRVGELTHMRKSWIHIDDEAAEAYGKHISIPYKGRKCQCDECLLNLYTVSKRGDNVMDKAWYRQLRKNFTVAKNKGKFINVYGRWRPKNRSASRKIPILPMLEPELDWFYSTYNSLMDKPMPGLSRVKVWGIVSRRGYKLLDKKIYPHALRATSASLWVNTGLDAASLTSILGWKNIETAQAYINIYSVPSLKRANAKGSRFEELIA